MEEGYKGKLRYYISLSDNGNIVVIETFPSKHEYGNEPRSVYFYENVGGAWKQIHDSNGQIEMDTSSHPDRRKTSSLDEFCDTLAPTEAPSSSLSPSTSTVPSGTLRPTPPPGKETPEPTQERRSHILISVTLAGTCQPNEDVAYATREGALTGFSPGITADVGGMVPSCEEGEGRGRGLLENLLSILLYFSQRIESCTQPLTAEVLARRVDANRASI